MNDEPATQGDAYREMVGNIGSDHPEQCWILTPFDTWERNPAYTGPDEPHPEDYQPEPAPSESDSYAERLKAHRDANVQESEPDEDYEQYYENKYDQDYRE